MTWKDLWSDLQSVSWGHDIGGRACEWCEIKDPLDLPRLCWPTALNQASAYDFLLTRTCGSTTARITAVELFVHQYLQTTPEYSPGTAILQNYTTAGQFNIISGQLVELIQGGLLYANVEQQANTSVTKLAMTFETTMNTYGTFAFSGDAVQWSVASISRPNLSAWLVCGDQQLFINLGAYAYLTPEGCADETVSLVVHGWDYADGG